jgi:hypothetical protein
MGQTKSGMARGVLAVLSAAALVTGLGTGSRRDAGVAWSTWDAGHAAAQGP